MRPAEPARRSRTWISVLGGIAALVCALPALVLVWLEVDMARAHDHPVSHWDYVAQGLLAAAWGLGTALVLFRRSTSVRVLIAPGVCGIAVALIGIAINAQPLLAPVLIGQDREAADWIRVAMIPGFGGLGHLAAQSTRLRGALDRVFYALAFLLAVWIVVRVVVVATS